MRLMWQDFPDAFSTCSYERFECIQIGCGELFIGQQGLNHGLEGSIKRMLQGVLQFADLSRFPLDGRTVQREVSDLGCVQQPLCHHSVHQSPDSAVGPTLGFGQRSLDVGSGAGFLGPNRFDDRPFGFGQLRSV